MSIYATVSLQKVIGEFEEAQNAVRQLKEDKKKLVLDLHSIKKQFEAQELVCMWTYMYTQTVL